MLSKDDNVAENTFAVCDAKTGVVYHVHSVVALDPANPATDSDAAAEALELAKATDALRGQLKVVKVPPQLLQRDVHFKLNVKLGTLEAFEPRSMRSRRKRSARKRRAR